MTIPAAAYTDVCRDGMVSWSNHPSSGQAGAIGFGKDTPIPFIIGARDVEGPDGKPVLGPDGEPVKEPIYTHGLSLRAATDALTGAHVAVVQGMNDIAYVVFRALRKILAIGPTFGTHGVAIGPAGEFINQISATVVEVNGVAKLIPAGIGAGQGILDVTPAGEILWTDDSWPTGPAPGRDPSHWKPVTLGGQRFVRPMRRGAWTVGHDGMGPERVIVFHHPTSTLFVAFNGRTVHAPHIAALPDGSAIVATSMPAAVVPSSAFQAWTPPDIVVPPPPPPPPPPPDPEEPHMRLAELYTDRSDIAALVNTRWPQLLERARREGETFRGAFVDQLAHVLNQIDNAANAADPIPGYLEDPWGRKYRNDGDPNSANDDALTFRLHHADASKKKLVDVVAGDRFEPGWDLRPASEEPGNGFWGPPLTPPLAEDGDDDDDDQDGDDDTPPAVDVKAELAAIRETVERIAVRGDGQDVALANLLRVLGERCDALEQRFNALPGSAVEFPVYKGTVKVLGIPTTITLTPQQK